MSARPNFLLVMSDQHDPMRSSTYGHPIVRTPTMDRLAREGVTFRHAYCNTPLCAPGRFSFMTGRYVHHHEGWDNATPHRSDLATWAHRLRAQGYDAVLAGKMHFLGPDQLHGFRAQLATDLHAQQRHAIYAWREEDGPVAPPHEWRHVAEAGPGTSPVIEVDDQVEAAALAYLREPVHARRPHERVAVGLAAHRVVLVGHDDQEARARARVAHLSL